MLKNCSKSELFPCLAIKEYFYVLLNNYRRLTSKLYQDLTIIWFDFESLDKFTIYVQFLSFDIVLNNLFDEIYIYMTEMNFIWTNVIQWIQTKEQIQSKGKKVGGSEQVGLHD